MDSFVKERLQQWNLGHLTERFQEEGVDEESFLLLDDSSITALIPRIGFRVKFKKYHSELLRSLGRCPVNNQSCADQSPVRNDSPTPTHTLETSQTRTTNSTFDIREILSNSGGSALVSSLDRDRHLSLKDRRQMVRLLVSHLMDRFGENPTAEIKKQMALAITAQFPCLKSNEGHGYEVWYTPCRYRHPATGYLEERLRNVRKRLRGQRQHCHPQPSHNSSSRPSFTLPESELSSTVIHTMIEWLKNNRSPHSQVTEFMRHTAPHRAAWVRSSGTKTVEEINREFPRLHDCPGMSVGRCPVNNQSCADQSPVRNDSPTPTHTLETSQTRTTNSTFDIREILSNSGGSALVSSLDRDRHLSLKDRRQMVRLLVSHLMDRFGENPTAEIKKQMALAITAQFPCLKSNEGHGYEVWYTPCRYRHPATGYLEERLRNVRKRLRGQRQHCLPQPSHNSSSRPSFTLPESELSSTVIHTMIEWLKNNRSPHSQVTEFMRHTAPHRAAWVRSSGTKTVEEINREFPRLHDCPGMILQDFGVLFPDHADRLYEFWAPVFTDRILLFAKKESKASDVLPENLEMLPIDVRGSIALNCLPVILPSSPFRTNGKIVRPTYAEMKRSFIDIQPVGTNMVHYLNSETSPDPHVLVLGDKENFSQVFVIFNGRQLNRRPYFKE